MAHQVKTYGMAGRKSVTGSNPDIPIKKYLYRKAGQNDKERI